MSAIAAAIGVGASLIGKRRADKKADKNQQIFDTNYDSMYDRYEKNSSSAQQKYLQGNAASRSKYQNQYNNANQYRNNIGGYKPPQQPMTNFNGSPMQGGNC